MNYSRLFCAITLLLSLTLIILPVQAAGFTDVPSGHIYKEQIEVLAGKGIVKGNPDGSFKPENTINRAELLTLLYRAANKTPGTPSKACFKDVGTGDWFSPVVCDASTRGYVGGYTDGNFKPGNAVNRVEALKMVHTVLGIKMNADASNDPLEVFTDVSLTAWYAPYMSNAFEKKILLITGQTGSKFYPEWQLKRGEAAAYIFNALGLKVGSASSAASSAAQRSSVAEQQSSQISMIKVGFPFTDDGVFKDREQKVYTFSVTSPATINVKATVNPGDGKTGVSCQLYKINATGFSLEYYIGHVSGNTCMIRASLGAGEYQMEVKPKEPGASYEVLSSLVKGDSNDGFREGLKLTKNDVKASNLEVDDHADWFYFKLTKEEKLTVEVTGTDNVRCIIYPMEDVDLFGFSGPNCNAEYDFPKGTYYIGVQRRDQREAQESFSIRYK